MSRIISDAEIQQLINEPKQLPLKWENHFHLASKTQETLTQRKLTILCPSGHEFTLYVCN